MFRGNVAAQEILAYGDSAGDDRQKLLEKDDYPDLRRPIVATYPCVLFDSKGIYLSLSMLPMLSLAAGKNIGRKSTK